MMHIYDSHPHRRLLYAQEFTKQGVWVREFGLIQDFMNQCSEADAALVSLPSEEQERSLVLTALLRFDSGGRYIFIDTHSYDPAEFGSLHVLRHALRTEVGLSEIIRECCRVMKR